MTAVCESHGIQSADWQDWGWQMRHRSCDVESLSRWIDPTEDECKAVTELAGRFHFVITPYYASLMDPDDPDCPIRRQVVPRMAEALDPAGLSDPLDEVAHSPVKNVIRVYPDRVAFCVNNECALYCRDCLRKRMVGEPIWTMKKRELEAALAWIRRTPEIRDVLLTGGDPLVYSDERLDWLLTELCAIPHVEIVRLRVRPYYVYQAQLLEGTAHFRTSIEEGVELFRALRGRTSGFAIPQYVLDHPYLRGREGEVVVVESYDGRLWREPNPKRPPVANTGVAKTGVAVIKPQ